MKKSAEKSSSKKPVKSTARKGPVKSSLKSVVADADRCLLKAVRMLHVDERSVFCAAQISVLTIMRRIGKLTAKQYAGEIRKVERYYGIKLNKDVMECVGEADIDLIRKIDKLFGQKN